VNLAIFLVLGLGPRPDGERRADVVKTTISSREFEENVDRMLERVEDGEEMEITRHGRVVARLLPPERHSLASEKEQDDLWAQLSEKARNAQE
jgi:prevent-host-death family protein